MVQDKAGPETRRGLEGASCRLPFRSLGRPAAGRTGPPRRAGSATRILSRWRDPVGGADSAAPPDPASRWLDLPRYLSAVRTTADGRRASELIKPRAAGPRPLPERVRYHLGRRRGPRDWQAATHGARLSQPGAHVGDIAADLYYRQRRGWRPGRAPGCGSPPASPRPRRAAAVVALTLVAVAAAAAPAADQLARSAAPSPSSVQR